MSSSAYESLQDQCPRMHVEEDTTDIPECRVWQDQYEEANKTNVVEGDKMDVPEGT